MKTNQQIIKAFYTALNHKDSKSMNALLADDIEFYDPAFGMLKGDEVKYMWQFLTENAKDFSLKVKGISAENDEGIAHWESTYTFATTGNKVLNIVNSSFEFKNGKIIKHVDEFDIKKWVKQALGNSLGIFGGGFLVKNMIQKKSKSLLDNYMKKNSLL